MELKFLVPDEKMFGKIEFASFRKDVTVYANGGRRTVGRSFNLYCDDLMVDDFFVEIPSGAGMKTLKPDQEVKLVNPIFTAVGVVVGSGGRTDYILKADDIVLV
jgi:Bacterial protein of unknown function (DUF961).